MPSILFRNLALLDLTRGSLESGFEVLVRGDQIAAVGKGVPSPGADTLVLDLGGRTLMPGLIDCHVHIHRELLPSGPTMLPSLITAHCGKTLEGMLMRGFTTVRDAAGADYGHKRAVELGLFKGPRLYVAGKAISQTGGHGDSRSPADLREPCGCVHAFPGVGRIADGVAEVRKAVRDEIRLGADQIKIMAGGGVASQSDPIDQLQYSMEELLAAVDEAQRSNTYVMAHVYTAPGIRRAVEAGVRTIEHGNLIDEPTARLMAKEGRYLIPNLIAYKNLKEHGKRLGYPELALAKLDYVLEAGARSVEIAQAAGIRMGFGTDLSRAPERQSEEFLLRAEIQKPVDVLRSATLIGAEVVRMEGKLGVVAAGAIADLIAVDGNPLEDLALLTEQGRHMPMIMANGSFAKNTLVA
ncbi:MAG: amidohydrolase family protein [Casimicrobiaceae bacterium]